MKVAVLLTGCGYLDGSEIQEVVATLIALDKRGIQWHAVAINQAQSDVVDHQEQVVCQDLNRNMLAESARIVRGKISPIAVSKPEDYDAVIVPGGFGVAKNISDFAAKADETYTINTKVQAFLQAFAKANKPAGFLCIAPILIPLIYPKGVQLTIGHDANIAKTLQAKRAKHINTAVNDICVDPTHRVISSPAYMLADNSYQAFEGIDRLVEQIQTWLKEA